LIVNGTRWTREIVDTVDFDVEREGNVVPQQLEERVVEQMHDVALLARVHVVGAEDVMPLSEEVLAKMATQETRTTGDQDSRAHDVSLCSD
jgi:hypothetical protein